MNIEEEARLHIKKFSNKTKFNISKISKDLDITRQTFKNKIENLRDQKIINNFTININPNSPVNLRYIILEIKTNPKEPHLVSELLKLPQLKVLDGIFGDFSLIGLFILESAEEYYRVLEKIDNIMAKSYFKKYHIIEIIRVFKTNGIGLINYKSESEMEIDAIDYHILRILQNKQKKKLISTYDMKDLLKKDQQIEISQSTIHNRIKKLEKNNIILNYTIKFCPKKIGYRGKYLVRIKPKDPSKYNELAIKLEKNQYITDLFRVGEQYGLFAVVRVKNVEDYGKFIRDLYDTEDIEDTWTNFILDELIPFTNFLIH